MERGTEPLPRPSRPLEYSMGREFFMMIVGRLGEANPKWEHVGFGDGASTVEVSLS